MAKKTVAPLQSFGLVSCEECIYKLNDDGVLMWCNKSKMPRPTRPFKHCIYKIIKENKDVKQQSNTGDNK